MRLGQKEYWDLETRLSKNALYKVLYAVFMCGGAITDTLTIPFNLSGYTPKQNAYNTGYYRITLPTGKRDTFEEISGFQLSEIPTVSVCTPVERTLP